MAHEHAVWEVTGQSLSEHKLLSEGKLGDNCGRGLELPP